MVAIRETRRRCLLGLVALAVVAVARPIAATETAAEEWKRQMAKAEAHLEAGEWAAAGEIAERLIPEMVPRLLAGEDERRFLAYLLSYRAVVAEAEGRRDDAIWAWQIAQNLAPAFRGSRLPDYGAPARALEAERLREAGAAPAGMEVVASGPEAGFAVPPSPLVAPVHRNPKGTYFDPWREEEVAVEVVIDADGRVRAPVVVGGEFPGHLYLVLEALREWRFAPARKADGSPLAARVTLDEFCGWRHSFAYTVVRDRALQPIHGQLLAGRWQDALAAAEESLAAVVVAGDRTGGPVGGPFSSTADEPGRASPGDLEELLVLRAVAEAGLGRSEEAAWHWHAAQSFDPRLLDLYRSPRAPEDGRGRWARRTATDLTGYGEPGRLLVARGASCAAGAGTEVCGGAVRLEAAAPPPGVTAPRPLSAPPAVPPPEAPREGKNDRLIVRAVVGTDGAPRSAWVRAGHSRATAYLALETLRSWRFTPASRDGRPVESIIELTVPLAAGAPAEAVAGWRRQADEIDAALRAGVADEAASQATAAATLGREIAAGVGSGGSDLLARAAALQALAEAAAGRQDDAAWHWRVAREFDAGLRYLDLAPYGAAGERLAEPAGEAESAEAGPDEDESDAEAGGADRTAPRVVRAPAPEFPAASADLPDLARIEVVVGTDGRPRDPRVISGRAAGSLFIALEALRGWRFAPATEAGEAVAGRFEVTLPLGARRPLAGLLAQVDDDDAKTLARSALLEARQGRAKRAACLWHAAQGLAPRLSRASFADEEAAGALETALDVPPDAWPLRRDRTARVGVPLNEQTVNAPVKVHAEQPQYTDAARKAQLNGVVIIQSRIDEEGEVVDARILKGLPHGLSASAIESVCSWTFKPATVAGKPIAVYYNLTINFTIGPSRPKKIPRTR